MENFHGKTFEKIRDVFEEKQVFQNQNIIIKISKAVKNTFKIY
jgi:hypothetical protein